ncbi:MAG: ABC transporter permease [Burkholderiaceae bacterium]
MNPASPTAIAPAQAMRAFPEFSGRWIPIWRRNYLVWKRLFAQSVFGNIAEPLITLFAFGYGLGSLLQPIGGIRYIVFLASGSICMNAFNAATFESLYSAFTRMHVQKSWEAMMNAPLSLDDVMVAELVWAATKSVFTGIAILLVIFVLGLSREWSMLLVLPLLFLIGLTAAALGLVVNSYAKNYDFFTYYFTIVVTPMWFLSGVFFPFTQLPAWVQMIARWLPLTAAVDLVRPLILGHVPDKPLFDLCLLLAYAILGFWWAVVLTRRRLLK